MINLTIGPGGAIDLAIDRIIVIETDVAISFSKLFL